MFSKKQVQCPRLIGHRCPAERPESLLPGNRMATLPRGLSTLFTVVLDRFFVDVLVLGRREHLLAGRTERSISWGRREGAHESAWETDSERILNTSDGRTFPARHTRAMIAISNQRRRLARISNSNSRSLSLDLNRKLGLPSNIQRH